jgi:saccharopine dehydrogenase-like NADP-dependent oxidoreductase
MKLLIIGAGGVGTSVAHIIKRAGADKDWAEKVVIADYNLDRAKEVAEKQLGGGVYVAEFVDASKGETIKALFDKHGIDWCLNLVEPLFNECIFDTCYECGVNYMDAAMTLSSPHPTDPFNKCGVKLGDYQFDRHEAWEKKGILALPGMGVEPGMADVFAKFAEKHLFDEIDEVNVRDGDNYDGGGDFGFSVWTTIEECLNPPVIWEKDKGWFTTENFSEPEEFYFPGGIGDVEVINVEHEEVLLIPRQVKCNRVTFKYGVPAYLRQMLLNLRALGLDEPRKKVKVGDSEIAPRDFLVKVIPNPVESTSQMTGKGCAGTWVTGKKDGKTRSVYLYQVADNQECIKKYTTNSVVAQTGFNPVIALELVAKGLWKANGVYGPEYFDPDPFVERMAKYEFPAGLREMDSEYAEAVSEKALLDALA